MLLLANLYDSGDTNTRSIEQTSRSYLQRHYNPAHVNNRCVSVISLFYPDRILTDVSTVLYHQVGTIDEMFSLMDAPSTGAAVTRRHLLIFYETDMQNKVTVFTRLYCLFSNSAKNSARTYYSEQIGHGIVITAN